MDLKDKIKSEVKITDVCERLGIALQDGGGGELRALCPLHDEDTPSFYVNKDKGFYHCFGCGSGGDLIRLVEETQGIDFSEALVAIAEWFGIEYDKHEVVSRRSLLKAALDVFRLDKKRAYEYAATRGISSEVAEKFELGIGVSGYSRQLVEMGYKIDEMIELGLVSESGRELFDGYVIIPLYNTAGIIVGISGRAIKDQQPRYMTTRSNKAFDKRKYIFGANVARDHIRKSREVVISEGQFDAMALHQAGIVNAVAILGSSFSMKHGISLMRMGADSIVSITDGDDAGISAANTMFAIAESLGISSHAVIMKQGNDPNDILVSEGSQELANIIDKSKLSHGKFLFYLAQRNAEKNTTDVVVELANILTRTNRYSPAYKEAIMCAENILGIDVDEFKRYLSSRVNMAERRRILHKNKRSSSDAVARAIVKCPTTGTINKLKEVFDEAVINSIIKKIPIEEGEPCEDVIKLSKELMHKHILEALNNLKQLASKGDSEAIIEMVRLNAKLQELKEELL